MDKLFVYVYCKYTYFSISLTHKHANVNITFGKIFLKLGHHDFLSLSSISIMMATKEKPGH